MEERRRLEKEKKRFAMRLEGTLVVERPPKVCVWRWAGTAGRFCWLELGAATLSLLACTGCTSFFQPAAD